MQQKSGLDESKLCMSLQRKRKLEAGEYANICSVLGVPMTMFVKPRVPFPNGRNRSWANPANKILRLSYNQVSSISQ